MQIISNVKTRALAVWAYLLRQQTPAIDIGDLQVTIGLGALTYGVSLLSVPAAWITFGTFLLGSWLAPRLPRRAKKG